MTGRNQDRNELATLLALLQEGEGTAIPTGAFRRTLRTARVAAGTGLNVLAGRLRKRGEGLGAADLATIEKLVRNFGELKGLAMKAGQIMSYIDETMPPEMQKLLSVLQTQSQPTSWDDVAATVVGDLGTEVGEKLLRAMARSPFSVASIGQVHKGILPGGTEVAVKVRHPGIVEAFESDFAAARLGPVFVRLLMPGAGAQSVRAFIDEMRARMLEECDFALEAERQRRFRQFLADHPTVLIPEVVDQWCSERVLVTRWEPGKSLADFLAANPSQVQRDRVGEALFDVYFGTLYRHGLFHADPHPGNYAFRADGRVVVYDFGCAREFDRETVRRLCRLGHAVAADAEDAIRSTFADLGGSIPESPKAYVHARKLLRGFFAPLLNPGPRPVDASFSMDMGELIKDKRMLIRLQIPGELLFLFRIRFGLYAVLSKLDARCDWHAFEQEAAARECTL